MTSGACHLPSHQESHTRDHHPNIILTWTGGGGGKKEEAEAEAEVEEGKKKSGCRLPDALFCGFQTSAYRSCPTSQMRIVELHARTTPKMWERSLACFYPFFFFFSVERGMELAILVARSYVIMVCMPIFSLTYAKHTFGFAWKESRHAHTPTHTHIHTHPHTRPQRHTPLACCSFLAKRPCVQLTKISKRKKRRE